MLTIEQIEDILKRLCIKPITPILEDTPAYFIFGPIFDKILDRLDRIEEDIADLKYPKGY